MRLLVCASVLCLVLSGCDSGGRAHSTASAGSAGTPASSAASTPASSAASTSPSTSPSTAASGPANRTVPRFDHIVVVVEENHSETEVLGTADAPYLNSLAKTGTVLRESYGIRHPSQPNYLALFSGSTQGLTDDSCPHTYRTDDLGSQLLGHGLTFAGYSESLPSVGYRGCSAGQYARKHAPWVDFANLPASVNRPIAALPKDWAKLPTVAFVIPNLDNDMHDGSVSRGDAWLRAHLGSYATWARAHNSLLIVTWDEDDFTHTNRIPGLLAGAHLRQGGYQGRVDHYTVLRTIEDAYGLPALGEAARRQPIPSVWTP